MRNEHGTNEELRAKEGGRHRDHGHNKENIQKRSEIQKGCRAMIACILFVFSCYSDVAAGFNDFTESL
ncbi:hypothetical protein J45TS6_13980 [Paenibacillus sp. J45TS6]|nr:hypothetical protein J45TS6_13980 [Paenibacillus sp. J45TS6]